MAAVGPAADQATDLLQKLSLDSKKTHDAPEVTDKANADAGEVPDVQIPPSDRSVTPLLQECMDQSRWYQSTPYYYGGYEGLVNEWDDYCRVDVPHPGVYGDMYHHGYRYAPYSPYPSPTSPVPTIAHDGQLYGPAHYQYPAQYYQPPTPHPASGTPHEIATSQGEVSTTGVAEKPAVPLDTTKGNSNAIANGKSNNHGASIQPHPTHQNSPLPSNGSYGRGIPPGSLSSGCQDPRFGFDGMRSPAPWYDVSGLPDGHHRVPTTSSAPSAISHVADTTSGRNQNLHPLPHLMGLHTPRPTSCLAPTAPGFVNRMYDSNRIYGQYGHYGTAFRTGLGFGSNGYHYRMNSRWGSVTDKYKPRGRGNGYYGYGSEDLDGLSELNRGPRGGYFKNTKNLGPNISIAVKGQNLPANGNVEEASLTPARDQYNRDDFPEKYSNAKFFVIKSYSEDDVHKSVKYNVWASTPNGNKKLDAAYQEAQKVAEGCPVFLFFSVNTSGQFVGVAEMAGPVDFNKTVDYWQQDKWDGCFPVKWYIVKDVPNSILKHITLENNDNKPVTNSRDTQEVKLEQGLQMLKIFKEHVSKTSILDDFMFYETRQKAMQEKNSKLQRIHKQVTNMKAAAVVDEKEKILPNGKSWLQKPLETVTILKKDPSKGTQGEQKPPEENGASSVSLPVTEKHVPANSVANTC